MENMLKYDLMKYRHRLLYYRVAPIYIRYTLYTTKKKTKLTNAIIVPYSRDRIVAASCTITILICKKNHKKKLIINITLTEINNETHYVPKKKNKQKKQKTPKQQKTKTRQNC
jgi:hypothetical protein